jgi:hypothetical protein
MNTKLMNVRWPRVLAGVGLTVSLIAGLVSLGQAQSTGGQAYGAYVNTPATATSQSPVVVLPDVSKMVDSSTTVDAGPDVLTVGNTLSTGFLNGSTSGAITPDGELGAQSTASAAGVNILNGLITADAVVATVESNKVPGNGAVSTATTDFLNLVVNGVQVISGDGTVASNTQISLPGVGYVVLNEQSASGNGGLSSGLVLNMIHVYLQSGGDIIVGAASSSVKGSGKYR